MTLQLGQVCPIINLLKGSEFIRKIEKLAKTTGAKVRSHPNAAKVAMELCLMVIDLPSSAT